MKKGGLHRKRVWDPLSTMNTQILTRKYAKNLRLFKERRFSNKWFMSCRMSFVLLRYNLTYDKDYTKFYKAISITTFLKHYANYKKCFNIPTYTNNTKLSIKYWVLKIKQLNPKVSWQIKRRYKSHTADKNNI